ncbi:MAG: S8 family serine peptidase [Myxococcota bacterium]
MNRKLNVVLTLTLLTGCTAGEPSDIASVRSAVSHVVPAIHCVDEVWVGIPEAGVSCPLAIAPWTSDRLGRSRTPDGRVACVYRWPVAGTPVLSGLPSDGTGAGVPIPATDWLDRDCPAVVPLANDDIHTAYHQGYHRQMDSVSTLPTFPARQLPGRVTVAVLDSSPDSGPGEIEPTVGPVTHGRQVSLAIREMSCPEGRNSTTSACIPEFETYQILDYASGVPAAGPVGHHGLLSTLAQHIEEAVTDWESRGKSQPLIINLSVGWHPTYHENGNYEPHSGTTSVRHSAAQAVRSAIHRASCEGALVIAAAGNRTGGGPSLDAGPLFPAGWAAEQTDCSSDPSGSPPAAAPLLYAASGVDALDRPLTTARPNSSTEIVAPAFMVAVDNHPAHPAPTPPLLPIQSGSSFSAAGLTAAAAVAWGYAPHLTPAAVIELVYRAATPLSGRLDRRVAELCHGTCRRTRRLSICNTASEAMAPLCGPGCSQMPNCATVPAGGGATVQPDTLPTPALLTPTGDWSRVWTSKCPGAVWTDSPTLGPNPCPDINLETTALWPQLVSSQPGSDPCPLCGVIWSEGSQRGYLYMEISNDLEVTTPLHSPVLNLNGDYYHFDEAFADKVMQPGDVYALELPKELPGTPEWATIQFSIDLQFEAADEEEEPEPYLVEQQIPIWYE